MQEYVASRFDDSSKMELALLTQHLIRAPFQLSCEEAGVR